MNCDVLEFGCVLNRKIGYNKIKKIVCMHIETGTGEILMIAVP